MSRFFVNLTNYGTTIVIDIFSKKKRVFRANHSHSLD